MSQYQRMVSYLYEYKQGVKGVNVGYVRIEQRGTGCRISLQMRSRNLGQLSDVAVFRQRREGIRYYTIGSLTERNGDYRCRIETESGNLMGSGIDLSDVDGIVLYQDDTYYVATTWKNGAVYLGESRAWDPTEPEEPEDSEESEDLKKLENEEPESLAAGHVNLAETPKDGQMALEQSDMSLYSEGDGTENYGQPVLGKSDAENHGQKIFCEYGTDTHGQPVLNGNDTEKQDQLVLGKNNTEKYDHPIPDREVIEQQGNPQFVDGEQQFLEEDEKQEDIRSTLESRGTGGDASVSLGRNSTPGMRQLFPRWTGMPLFRRRPPENGNIPIPQMAEWSNGSRHMAESKMEDHTENKRVERDRTAQEASVNGSFRENKEQVEEQAVCRNCPFKRRDIDYGKRILMTFPVMRPFPNDQQLSCVRIEPQDLGCLPMQMWTLANNHFLLQGYYCYRHLIFMEMERQKYALGVPGIYDRRTSRQAEQFGFVQFRTICGGRQCEGAFGYWIMPLSC